MKMKNIFATIIAAAAVLTGCNTVLIESEGVGHLSLELTASDEYVATSKADGANENVNEFVITIKNKADGSIVKSYARFADMPQVIDLMSGAYTIEASSPATLPAAFNQPIYGTSHDFTVKIGEVSAERLICTLQNVKVTFSLTEAFTRELDTYTISVSNGDAVANTLYWTNVPTELEGQYTTKTIATAGYFHAAPLTIRVDGKRTVDGSEAYHVIKINDAQPRDHYIVKLDAKVTGSAGFNISIDPGVNVREDEVYVPGFDEDPVQDPEEDNTGDGDDNGSGEDNENEGEGDGGSGEGTEGEGGSSQTPANDMTMTWAGHESVNNVYPSTPIDDDLGEVNLIIDVPGKIAGFMVQIDSEDEGFMSAVYEMTTDGGNRLDLVNDSKAIQAMMDVELLTGNLAGLTSVPFNLTGLLPLISVVAAPGTNHVFTLTVTDETGYSETWKLTFSLPNA